MGFVLEPLSQFFAVSVRVITVSAVYEDKPADCRIYLLGRLDIVEDEIASA